ncbi:alpha/beta hydrolase [Aquincola sp. S2]|uniref:Alpha/beta hydrolase n=1 Tax=Pseudaquabacterium terrae TaxID=2732868 RepID=A0ABX2ECQ7_9BURK|nr:alpha/beta hydrolase [Aquabacterium terrae]NRF66269.1 alpha/beta hydrolase [Aquabacterium terrae]
MQTLQTEDGLPLHLRHWALAAAAGSAPAARGSVLIVHGLGEHIGRYAHVAAHLNANAWHVIGYDQRGHGASGGARGAMATPDSLLDDLARVIDALRQARPGPLVLLGHSMGGLIAGRFVAEGLAAQPAPWWRPVEALVMSSPALDPGMNAFQKGLLALLGPLAPNLAVNNGLNPAWVSRDPAVVAAYVEDPLVHDRVTPRLARFIVDGGEVVRAAAPRWTLPTALLYAGADRCVAPRGSDAFAAAAPRDVVFSKRYDGFSHEIFNEPEQREVLATLSRWLVPHGALNS